MYIVCRPRALSVSLCSWPVIDVSSYGRDLRVSNSHKDILLSAGLLGSHSRHWRAWCTENNSSNNNNNNKTVFLGQPVLDGS